jgi:selenocysteine lyase/cysteine desulfurase
MDVDWLRQSPNPLAAYYTRFRVAERLLLTGHSHQAWPDPAEQGVLRAFADAAECVDEKWARVEAVDARVRSGFAQRLHDATGDYALGQNTHELLVCLLSALELPRRPRIVTSTGEFHSARRQFERLEEEGVEIVRVDCEAPDTLVERMAAELDDRTALCMLSSVMYETAAIIPGLGHLARACERVGVPLLVDAYHQLGVVPMDLGALGLETAFVIGGGYKYCQLGEGNAFLRIPAGCELRPVVTGWFASFDELEQPRSGARVGYGPGPQRFAGATYDPTSRYRAAAVFDFFDEQRLDVELLRAISQHQLGLMMARFDALDADPALIARERERRLEDTGGFLVLRSPAAGAIREALRARGVRADQRRDRLRLGPAPYLSDSQLEAALGILGEVVAQSPPADQRSAPR